MKKILIGLMLMLPLMLMAENIVSPLNKNIRYVGRVTTANGKCARFTYPGTQIRASFQGTSLKMKMKPNSGFFMVELDDMEPYKIECPKTDSVMTVATGLRKGSHNVIVTMVTEGNGKKPEFWGLLLDNGCSLTQAPKLPKRKIEFIGNSITCGYGVEGKSGSEKFSFATENQWLAYDAITARNLNAQCMAVARSGMGVYRNCGGNVAGDKVVMTKVYPYTLFGTTGEQWDFSRFIPDVVCINEGTNDSSSSKYNHTLFVNAYCNLIKTVKANYHGVPVVILSGTMIKGKSSRDIILRELLDNVRDTLAAEGIDKVYRLDLTPEDNTMGWGADYHPSAKRQQFMAEELTAFLRKIMGWE